MGIFVESGYIYIHTYIVWFAYSILKDFAVIIAVTCGQPEGGLEVEREGGGRSAWSSEAFSERPALQFVLALGTCASL